MEDSEGQEQSDLKERKSLYEKLWMSRSNLQKRLIAVAIVFIIIFVIILLVYLFVLRKPEICTSSACLETSMDLLNQVDVEMDPCLDFYRFSCGNFLKNTNLERVHSRSAPDIMKEEIQLRIKSMLEQPVRSEQPRYLNLAKEFYRACMNESAIEAESLKWMKQIFIRIGGWPILQGSDWEKDNFDWKRTVHKLKQMGVNFEFLISVSVERDKKDPAKYVLQIKDPYKSDSQPIGEDIQRIYLRYMEDVAVYFGRNLVHARIEQQDVLDFTLRLAKISEDGKKNNMSNIFNPYSLSELQHEFSSINWYDFINGFLAPNDKLNYDDEILVPDPYYIKEFEHLMLNTSSRVVANFIAWHTLQTLINFMPEDLVNKAYDYLEAVNGRYLRKARWEMCVNNLKERMGPVISSVFIEQYFDEETRMEVSEMIHEIKDHYRRGLKNFDWINEATRKLILEKLTDSAADILSYDDINSLMQVSAGYNDVKIYHDNILLSVLNLEQYNMNAKFRKLREMAHTNWLEDPNFVTGLQIVLSPHDNILVFPVGLFSSIYYAKFRPQYLNYGALGSLIGQKVWQTFTEAKYKEMAGEARSWWSPITLLNYQERLRCLEAIIGRSGSSTANGLNASTAAEEDLGFLIGVKVAYDSYETWVNENDIEPQLPGVNFSPKQLFWIYFARPFCTKYVNYAASIEQMRVNGIVSNLQEFADDFNCGGDDIMNLKEKCNIF